MPPILKPYCFLKPSNDHYNPIYLVDGETMRISRDGRVVSPVENPKTIHIRVRPNVAAKTVSVIYVNNYEGFWINNCMALCWYEYILNHGHTIKLQVDSYEYKVTFFPNPKTEVAPLLTLNVSKSLTEIPKKVMAEIIREAKKEYFKEKDMIMTQKTNENNTTDLQKYDILTEIKSQQKCNTDKKSETSHEISVEKHVCFKTRPKTVSSVPKAESVQILSTDDPYNLPRKVSFNAPAEKERKLYRKHVDKSVKFLTDTDSVKSIVFSKLQHESDVKEIEPTKSEILKLVSEIYKRLQNEEREYVANRNFVVYLIERVMRKIRKLKRDNLKFIHDLLDDVIEDVTTMKEKNLDMAKKVVDDVVEQVFTENRGKISDGFFKELIREIFTKITESEIEINENKNVMSDSSDTDSSEITESQDDGFIKKIIYHID